MGGGIFGLPQFVIIINLFLCGGERLYHIQQAVDAIVVGLRGGKRGGEDIWPSAVCDNHQSLSLWW